ncbi:hypothetical protein L1887_48090 [Cichorium endivia]|nr:hypothetical protein L1887_48090 [Cichorium endivia]
MPAASATRRVFAPLCRTGAHKDAAVHADQARRHHGAKGLRIALLLHLLQQTDERIEKLQCAVGWASSLGASRHPGGLPCDNRTIRVRLRAGICTSAAVCLLGGRVRTIIGVIRVGFAILVCLHAKNILTPGHDNVGGCFQDRNGADGWGDEDDVVSTVAEDAERVCKVTVSRNEDGQ